jgi:hypothetical protein
MNAVPLHAGRAPARSGLVRAGEQPVQASNLFSNVSVL